MNPLQIILSLLYYIIIALISFMAIFTVYVLIRYGISRAFSVFLSLVFIFLFLTALSGSYSTLQGIV